MTCSYICYQRNLPWWGLGPTDATLKFNALDLALAKVVGYSESDRWQQCCELSLQSPTSPGRALSSMCTFNEDVNDISVEILIHISLGGVRVR